MEYAKTDPYLDGRFPSCEFLKEAWETGIVSFYVFEGQGKPGGKVKTITIAESGDGVYTTDERPRSGWNFFKLFEKGVSKSGLRLLRVKYENLEAYWTLFHKRHPECAMLSLPQIVALKKGTSDATSEKRQTKTSIQKAEANNPDRATSADIKGLANRPLAPQPPTPAPSFMVAAKKPNTGLLTLWNPRKHLF